MRLALSFVSLLMLSTAACEVDAGSGAQIGADAAGGNGEGGGGGNGGGGQECPAVAFTAKSITPSIQLVIDRSGSMGRGFGNTSRWNALKDALVSSTGVVTTLQAKAYFGATIYPGSNNCSSFESTATRGLNAAQTVKDALNARSPNNGPTPTGPALTAALQTFQGAGAPPAGSPPVMVLATDGDPNGCNDESFNQGQQQSVNAAKAAFAAGVKVYVLSVGPDASLSALQEVANAGQGITAGQPNAKVYTANDPAQLKTAFDAIIGGVASCAFDLSGNIDPAQAAQGTVRLNGRALSHGTEWRAVDANTIELVNAACDELKAASAPIVNASFPCGAVIE